ncbi:MAG: HEAT repeat domain-containing protein [Candidatus Rokubacteria bacterium]|nr:HEAT repeat domain-containing protein [Candidatus Rokubacteria bacterium]
MTPADTLMVRAADPFCGNEVLGAVNELADATHSKPISDLVTEGRYRPELLVTLGKSAAPRYAHFIGRYKDDRDPMVRQSVATGLGLIDNDAITIPVLIQLLARPTGSEEFSVRWEASEALVKIGKRKPNEGLRRRVLGLFQERDPMTVTLAARALAMLGDPRGPDKLRELTAHGEARVREEALLALADRPDQGAREVVTRRLKDDNLAVRACAIWALGRIAGPSAEPLLRSATQDAIAYEQQLLLRKQRGESEDSLRDKYGLGAYDLRETLQEALRAR